MKISSPKFSIVIPVYNVAPYLRECLDSVLAQIYGDWEAICVDDGSTDGSGAILDEYAAHDDRWVVIHQENRGVSDARNAALDVARGEWVAFLDGDDAIDLEWLEMASQVISETNADLVRMRCRATIKRARPVDCTYRVFEDEAALNWGITTFFGMGWSWLNFIRRDKVVRFPDGMRLCEDNIFLLKTLKNLRRVVQCEFDGYFYRAREDAATERPYPVGDCLRIFQEVRELSYERTSSFLLACSRFLANIISWWNKKRIAAEGCAEVIEVVREMRRDGLFSLRVLPFKAKLQIVPFWLCGSQIGYRLVHFISKMKGAFQ